MADPSTLKGRCMYIWQLRSVLVCEMGINTLVRKAKKARLAGVWIKVAEGGKPYNNITGDMANPFREVVTKLQQVNIDVWGWHIPYAATLQNAEKEAEMVSQIAQEFALSGILMDAESESAFFKGTPETAEKYASRLKSLLFAQGKGLAISSHDIPTNFAHFPFNSFAMHATVNAPQVYYGGSSSVDKRLSRAIQANSHLNIPFVPVGAAWLGPSGGCDSASACSERAIIFIRLVRSYGYQGYSFWHWQGAPSKFWEILFTEPE